MKEKLVVIGNGMSGLRTIEDLLEINKDKYEITIYTSCWNSQKGIYYYTTYNRRQITAVNMHKVNLDAQQLTTYPMLDDEEFYEQN